MTAQQAYDRRGRPSASDTGGSSGQDHLARRMSEVARSLQSEGSLEDTLAGIVAAATATVPGAQRASISVVQGGRPMDTLAATDDTAALVDDLQRDTGQGPCLDTLHHRSTVRLADVAAEPRWPEFSRRAGELGVASVLSLQLFTRGDDLGALNLSSAEPGAFTDDSEHVGLLFAAHAAVALVAAQQQTHLTAALSTRDLIGQAKGVLMERHRLTADQAFALLVRTSQEANLKLRDLAVQVTSSTGSPTRH